MTTVLAIVATGVVGFFAFSIGMGVGYCIAEGKTP